MAKAERAPFATIFTSAVCRIGKKVTDGCCITIRAYVKKNILCFLYVTGFLVPNLVVAHDFTWPIQGKESWTGILLYPTGTIYNVYREIDQPFGDYLLLRNPHSGLYFSRG